MLIFAWLAISAFSAPLAAFGYFIFQRWPVLRWIGALVFGQLLVAPIFGGIAWQEATPDDSDAVDALLIVMAIAGAASVGTALLLDRTIRE
jgi:hypothetical protein